MERLKELNKRIEQLEKQNPKDLSIDLFVIDERKDNLVHVIQKCTYLFGKGFHNQYDMDLWIEAGKM